MGIKKTVIGSFPRLPFNVNDAIKTVIDLQLRNEIDIVSDGEQRGDMITYFENIPGFKRSHNSLKINSKITPPDDPCNHIKVKDAIFANNYLKKIGKGNTVLKTAITGPISLGVTCGASGLGYYSGLNDLRLYRDLVEALESIIVNLLNQGSYIQIDEPGLSAGYMEPTIALSILRELFSYISSKKKVSDSISIHVCGNLSRLPKILEGLLELDLDVVSLAFSGPIEKSNVSLLTESSFRDSGKHLGVGCTKVAVMEKNDLELSDQIYQRIKSVAEKVGKDAISYAHPDCGLKGTPIEISELLLKRLSEAVDQHNSAQKNMI